MSNLKLFIYVFNPTVLLDDKINIIKKIIGKSADVVYGRPLISITKTRNKIKIKYKNVF